MKLDVKPKFDLSLAQEPRCARCSTFAGCSRHHLYKCRGCLRVLRWEFGADDDMPGHCDDCWAKAHAVPA